MKHLIIAAAFVLVTAAPAFADDAPPPMPPMTTARKPPAAPEQPKIDPNASITLTVTELQTISAFAAQQGKLESLGTAAKPIFDRIQAQASKPAEEKK